MCLIGLRCGPNDKEVYNSYKKDAFKIFVKREGMLIRRLEKKKTDLKHATNIKMYQIKSRTITQTAT